MWNKCKAEALILPKVQEPHFRVRVRSNSYTTDNAHIIRFSIHHIFTWNLFQEENPPQQVVSVKNADAFTANFY